jgi:hypothetical protein
MVEIYIEPPPMDISSETLLSSSIHLETKQVSIRLALEKHYMLSHQTIMNVCLVLRLWSKVGGVSAIIGAWCLIIGEEVAACGKNGRKKKNDKFIYPLKYF